jgi:tetratricopeptide (TPR) repeat protein
MKSVKFVVASLILFVSVLSAHAELKTFIKEYNYQASEDDSKNSSRTVSLREVKRLLLEQLGTYLESETEVKNFQLTKDQITTLTAGIVQTEIVEEKWDGRSYWMKSKITADSDQVVRAIDTLRKDREKTKELNEVRRRSDALLKENEKLRKELTQATGKDKKKKAAAYAKTIRELTADEWFEKGYSFIISGDYQNALDAFNKVIELNPTKNEGAYFNRGFAYGKLGNYKQAIRDFDKAIEINPKASGTYQTRGASYKLLGNNNQAIRDYDKAIEINPKYVEAYLLRGVVYYSRGNNNQAIRDYDKAIEIDPKFAETYLLRGILYASLGNVNQSIRDYDKVIEINPKHAKAYLYRGKAYAELGNYKQEIVDMKIAARLGDEAAQSYLRGKGISW